MMDIAGNKRRMYVKSFVLQAEKKRKITIAHIKQKAINRLKDFFLNLFRRLKKIGIKNKVHGMKPRARTGM